MYNVIKFLSENNIKSVLDIGANIGDWASTIKKSMPHVKIFSIEANPECEKFLVEKNLNYKICCLSNVKTNVKFYKDPNSIISTGCSYYLENTKFFSENNFINMETDLLDSIVEPDEYFEYIKLDTQGSELDIIRGGMRTISRCRYLQIETSSIEYNLKSPMKKEVFDHMESINFEPLFKIENHYMNENLIQEDFIFKNISKD